MAPAQDPENMTGEDSLPRLFRPDLFEQSTKVHDFTTPGDLKRRVYQVKCHTHTLNPETHEDHYVVFRHVSRNAADDIWDRSHSLVDKSRLAYDAVANVMIVLISFRPQEETRCKVDRVIAMELFSMDR